MIKRLLIWNHKRFPDAFVVALGGFFMGGLFILSHLIFLILRIQRYSEFVLP